MKELATWANVALEVRDADQLITTDDFQLRMHPDSRGFAFMTCKVFNEEKIPTLEEKFSRYI